MPYHFDFDPINKILRCRAEGAFGEEALKECYELINKHAAIVTPQSAIFDLTAVTSFDVSARTIRMQAERAPAFPDPERLRFVVAPNDTLFGMARMFQLVGESTRPNMHVVRSLDEVYAILGISEPRFETLSLPSSNVQRLHPKIAG